LSQPSLSINEAEDGKVLMHCHAGCDLNDIRWLFDSFDCRAYMGQSRNFTELVLLFVLNRSK
jgi:hypothetical protein